MGSILLLDLKFSSGVLGYLYWISLEWNTVEMICFISITRMWYYGTDFQHPVYPLGLRLMLKSVIFEVLEAWLLEELALISLFSVKVSELVIGGRFFVCQIVSLYV